MNSSNITATNFGNDASKRFLGDVTVSIRLHGDTSNTFYPIGYCDPEKSFSSKRDYAEFVSGMPEIVVAKDLTKITYSFKAKLKQFQAETFALACGSQIDSSQNAKRVLFGTDLPPTLELSMILSGATKDGKTMELYVRKAQVTPETIEIALGSKEYGAIPFEAVIVADDHPLETNWDWPVFNEIECTGCSLGSTDTDITTSGTSELAVGMYAYTENAGFMGIIEELSTDGVTAVLDRVSGSTDSTADVKFVDPDDIAQDNIAFFEFSS